MTRVRRRATLGATLLGLVLGSGACGAPATTVAPEHGPRASGAAAYDEMAERACSDCRDAACFRDARVRFRASVEEAGGIDELPAAAHRALERLEQCTLAYSDDAALAVERACDEICACETADCVESFVELWPEVQAALEDEDEDVHRDAAPAVSAAEACLRALSVSAVRYAVIAGEAADAMCACSSLGCAEGAMDARQTALDGAVYVEPGPERAAGHASDTRTCECFGRAAASTVNDAVGGMIGVPVTMRWSIDCDLDGG